MRNNQIIRMSDAEHIAVSIMRSHNVPHMTREWKDYETAKHYINLQTWPEPQDYAAALKAAAEWVGV